MIKAVLQKGAIIPTEPLPSDWQEGAALEVARAEPPAIDIDAWAKTMAQLCADSAEDDEDTMRRAIAEQRRQSKEQVRRDFEALPDIPTENWLASK